MFGYRGYEMKKHLSVVWMICFALGCAPAVPAEDNAFSNAAAGTSSVSTVSPGADLTQLKIKERTMKEQRSGTWSPGLAEDEKSVLFAIAEDTLQWCVNRTKGEFPMEQYNVTPKLKEQRATFVTLEKDGQLRGCIGSLAPVEALYLSVHHNAINAALEDPRFSPVQPSELPHLEIHVSILSPIVDIPSLNDFKIGQHGIILEQGRARAVFLPEVAVEQGWSKEETLSYLSMKAGLPRDAWRKDTRFKVFESVVLAIEPGKP